MQAPDSQSKDLYSKLVMWHTFCGVVNLEFEIFLVGEAKAMNLRFLLHETLLQSSSI